MKHVLLAMCVFLPFHAAAVPKVVVCDKVDDSSYAVYLTHTEMQQGDLFVYEASVLQFIDEGPYNVGEHTQRFIVKLSSEQHYALSKKNPVIDSAILHMLLQ